MTRVLIACDWFLKYATRQAAALAGTGTPVALLCRDHALEFGESASEREAALDLVRASGAEVIVLEGRVTDLGSLPRATRAVRRFRPDVVHLHDNQDPRLAALAALTRSVVTVHDPVPHTGALDVGRIRDALRTAVRRTADAFVVHSDGLAAELEPQAAGRQIDVVPHGVAVAAAPVVRPTVPTVLFFGRLQPYKGLSVLLDAMPKVWADRPDVRLVIAGDGPEADLVPKDPRVELLSGYLPEADVPGLIAGASVLALPYTQASQSGVAALAVGSGVPCVVSNAGGLPEYALDDSWVAPAGDPAALAAVLLRHLDHPAAIRTAVLERARARWSWERAAELTLPLYAAVA